MFARQINVNSPFDNQSTAQRYLPVETAYNFCRLMTNLTYVFAPRSILAHHPSLGPSIVAEYVWTLNARNRRLANNPTLVPLATSAAINDSAAVVLTAVV